MNSLADPNRFTPCQEPLKTTVVRNIATTIIIASVITLIRLHHLPASSVEWHRALTLVVVVLWITFGGHFIELLYLNVLRPRIANWSDTALIFVRLCLWAMGGAILFTCAIISQGYMMRGQFPSQEQIRWAAFYGGPLLIGVELAVHALLLFAGKRSFWNLKG